MAANLAAAKPSRTRPAVACASCPAARRLARPNGGGNDDLARRQASPPRSLPNPRDAACRPVASVTRGGRAARIERAGDQGGLLQAATLEPSDQATGLRGSAAIEGSAGVEACCRMGATMPAHQKIELVGIPAASGRPQPLAVQRRGKAGIGGHAGPTQLVQQVAQMGRYGGVVRHFHRLRSR